MSKQNVHKSKLKDEFFNVDYRKLPKKISTIIKPEPEPIRKPMNIVHDGKHYLVRIPTEVAKVMDIGKGDKIEFLVKLLPEEPTTKELTMSYIRRSD
jgi:hypothetical protein